MDPSLLWTNCLGPKVSILTRSDCIRFQMPGTIGVRVLGARNLPVMDKSAETTDAFVEVRFGSTSYKTAVFAKSLAPRWNTDWLLFEAEDIELQDECVQLRSVPSTADSLVTVFSVLICKQ